LKIIKYLVTQDIVIIHAERRGVLKNIGILELAKLEGNFEGRGVQIAEGGVFSNSFRLKAVYRHSFFPERECIGNYIPNSQVVLIVYNFNTLPLYRKEYFNTI